MDRASIDEMARQHDRRQLVLHKQYFERTANPLWLYEALKYVPRGEPYPVWIDAYFRQCREELWRLTFPRGPRPGVPAESISAADAADRMLYTLGFRRSPNWNAIEDRRLDNTRFGVFNAHVCTPSKKRRRVSGEKAQELGVSKATVRRLLREATNLEKP